MKRDCSISHERRTACAIGGKFLDQGGYARFRALALRMRINSSLGTNIGPNACLPREDKMTPVQETLFWLTGVPLPIILVIALYLHPG